MPVYRRLTEQEFERLCLASNASALKKSRAYRYCVLGQSFREIAAHDDIHHRTAARDVSDVFTKKELISYE